MVTNQAAIKRNGVQDYVTLRTSAFVILAFTLYMVYVFASSGTMTYESWKAVFTPVGMKAFTLITLIAVLLHVRIGLWQVLTDYVKNSQLRVILQYVLNLAAVAYVAIGLFVLWGV